eukprot:Gb_32219 [translate_table: standard]
MTAMLSSQGIGLITVIAVSGCSVMLLVLGRQKLLELKKDSAQDSCQGKNEEGDDGSPWPSCSEEDAFSRRKKRQAGESISWRINSGPCPKDCNIADSSMDSENISGQFQMPNSSRILDVSKTSQTSSAKKCKLVKKVRFSEDVVEPSSNNVEYRRRHTLAIRSGRMKTQGKAETTSTQTLNSRRINPINYSYTVSSEGDDAAGPCIATMDASTKNLVKEDCKMQTLAKPNIPPNRMVLYNGISRYKSQRAILH